MPILRPFLLLFVIGLCSIAPRAEAADRAKLEAFLQITGFDVALESIKLSANSAPEMIGVTADAFGSEWKRLTDQVFKVDVMHGLALDILGETLDEDLLDHAAGFYASPLGARIVEVENASHLEEDDGLKREQGDALVAALERVGSERLDYFKRLNAAADSAGTAIRAIQEVQVRFLMAAAGAGVIEMQLDEADLRELLSTNEEEMRESLEASGLSGSAYTYQAFSDAEVLAYTEALEHEKMRKVYDLMNAVQYEIMANRFEALAAAMAKLQPSQEL